MLAPIHLIIPKNCVLSATPLFILPAIIKTPAVNIMTNNTPAIIYSPITYELELNPVTPKSAVFSDTLSSVRPYSSFISEIARLTFVCSPN